MESKFLRNQNFERKSERKEQEQKRFERELYNIGAHSGVFKTWRLAQLNNKKNKLRDEEPLQQVEEFLSTHMETNYKKKMRSLISNNKHFNVLVVKDGAIRLETHNLHPTEAKLEAHNKQMECKAMRSLLNRGIEEETSMEDD